ncbi:MAG: type III-A CRISPR-associated RAMP protein Csm3 [Deltaproteobacteria bacterium RIFOXYD12_FULL_56_24]|nr:MAG: type III-A CRISPR-associated RAMP protein Csm3 [Deltaproteobacteria bacterium RIFOXYD12_FULL_56_24]
MTEHILKLEKKVFIEGEIVLLTGMHVGGSSLGLSIGGADKVVVRNPLTNLPYIPGSSLKGKMRSLLEKSLGLIRPEQDKKGNWEGKLCENPEEDVVQLFGFAADKGGASLDYAPTRLTVRDGSLINVDELANSENTDMHCTEIKTEVSIDRLTSQANPRNFERVPAGARFKLDMVLDIYNVDVKNGAGTTRADAFIDLLNQGLMLVEDDYLGGQGTRGYGQVQFNLKAVTERTAEDYCTNKDRRNSSFKGKFGQFFRSTGEVS